MGASREGAEPELYEREDDERPSGGVSAVEPGRWAASIFVRDTGDMLDVGTYVPPHRVWSRPCTPVSMDCSPCQQAGHGGKPRCPACGMHSAVHHANCFVSLGRQLRGAQMRGVIHMF